MPIPLQAGLLVVPFVLGIAARRRGLLSGRHAGWMLELVLNVGLPALFIANISRLPLSRELLALPASAIVIMLAILFSGLRVGRRMGLARADTGALLLCGMSMNTAFLFPFVLAGWGSEAFAQMALFDLGHALMQGSLVYAVAASFGNRSAGLGEIARKVLAFPLLWALAVALAINISGYRLPGAVVFALDGVGRLILLLLLLALGILFDVRLVRSPSVVATLLLRMVLGLGLGLLLATAFGLSGLPRAVLVLGAAAPIGFNSVVLANREKLNRDLAASAASISVLLGFACVPLALWLFRP